MSFQPKDAGLKALILRKAFVDLFPQPFEDPAEPFRVALLIGGHFPKKGCNIAKPFFPGRPRNFGIADRPGLAFAVDGRAKIVFRIARRQSRPGRLDFDSAPFE